MQVLSMVRQAWPGNTALVCACLHNCGRDNHNITAVAMILSIKYGPQSDADSAPSNTDRPVPTCTGTGLQHLGQRYLYL